MFAFAQPTYHQYNPYQDLAMQQELQRRRQIEAYLRRQQQVEEMERRQREYEAAVRRAEYERRRQAELQRRRQTQQARTRHSMYDGGLEALFDALYGAQGRRQEECQTSIPLWRSPKPTPELESMHASTHAPVPAPSPTPSPVAVDAEPTPNTEPKSEPEPEQEEPQTDTASSHAAIQSILASFATLQSEFTFPSQLDFLPDSSPTLAYTPNNAPLHGYEHALTGLLTKLDGVESYGDGDVRRARKEAVKAIEKELERLDGMKVDRWRYVSERQAEVTTAEADRAEVDPVSVPLPEDMDVEEDEKEAIGCEETAIFGKDTSATVIDSTGSQVEGVSASDAEEPEDAIVQTTTNATPISTPHIPDTEHVTLQEAPNDVTTNAQPLHITNPGPLTRSLTSPSLSEASESESDVELEEYVDVETMSTSEDERNEMEEVEKDGELELTREWELDF